MAFSPSGQDFRSRSLDNTFVTDLIISPAKNVEILAKLINKAVRDYLHSLGKVN